ncbi:ABC transporter permease [Pantoea dispersa]|uniref:ABC transporter permease n=1 Tax=Pantoea dispersa TaxID=59814 RepID=UPI002DBD2F9E|nr:ABC transporter permease [Pantoea dispersa]MEB5836189.1 ABC transporter permease [Pantoea dispersa]
MHDIKEHASDTAHPVSIKSMVSSILNQRHLIYQMAKREILSKYRGSSLGLLWSVITPMVMLTIYTFLFSVVFKAKWNVGANESKYEFAIVLFAGLLTHAFLAEVLNKSPSLITSNVNYVKKVVFPLEVMVIINLIVCMFNTLISVVVLLVAILIIKHSIPISALLLPAVMLPLIILASGLSWMLASFGVYIRDIGQSITILTTILTFLSPIFYPASAVPAIIRPWLLLNPLTFIIEQVRNVLIWGVMPDFKGLVIYLICSAIVCWSGYIWFQKTRKGFADVL